MRHNDQIILPYAVSDTFSNFATIKIPALMQSMKAWSPSRNGDDRANCLERRR
jgi:hypothetical protein